MFVCYPIKHIAPMWSTCFKDIQLIFFFLGWIKQSLENKEIQNISQLNAKVGGNLDLYNGI